MQREHKVRHDCVDKLIHWELRKFKLDHTNRSYMHNPEFGMEKEMHKHLWEFKIQMYHQNVGDMTRPSDCQQENENLPNSCRVKLKESKRREKYLDLAWELKKLFNMKKTVSPIVTGVFSTVTKGLVQGLEYLEIRRRVVIIKTTLREKYLDLAWELKKLFNMKKTVSPIVTGVLVQSPKDWFRG